MNTQDILARVPEPSVLRERLSQLVREMRAVRAALKLAEKVHAGNASPDRGEEVRHDAH